ncbi:transcriptional activator RinB [Staphylococcus aureus M1115]|nr:transcriptional activator RinB [Staphylococcus aureus M1115]
MMIKKLKNMDWFDIFIAGILRLLFLLAMYELGKYVTEQVYIMMTANDDVEVPSDFAKFSDQSDLMRAEVSE